MLYLIGVFYIKFLNILTNKIVNCIISELVVIVHKKKGGNICLI